MSGVWSLLLLLISYGAGRLAVPAGLGFLDAHGVTARNYRGERIPTGFGGALAVLMTALSLLNLVLVRVMPLFSLTLLLATLFASVAVTFFGWLDDTLGSHGEKGFRGHLGMFLREGRLTTGALKAAGGGVVAAVAASVTARSFPEWLLHTLFIVLMTNWLNLLDLRPGRTLKFYLAGGTLLFVWGFFRSDAVVFIPLFGLGASVLRHDLSARLMLGDSGANLLGLQLGMWTALLAPVWVTGLLTLLLAAGHFLAERVSFTRIIETNRWLAYLDRLGRRES